MKKHTELIIAVIELSFITAILFFYRFVDARETSLLPKCPTKLLFSFDCPGCGSQRALSSISHFELHEAIKFNLLLVIALPLVIYLILHDLLFSVSIIHKRSFIYRTKHLMLFFWLVIAYTIFRNTPFYPYPLP